MSAKQKITIGIFSSSRIIHDSGYNEMIKKIGNSLCVGTYRLVYGGGENGAMGIIPSLFSTRGGDVTGIDCMRFYAKYGAPSFCTTEVHEKFYVRQESIVDRADVILCLPGGIGTLSELTDVLTQNDLAITNKKVFLLNHDGFFDSILDFVRKGIEGELITCWEKLNIHVISTADDFLTSIKVCLAPTPTRMTIPPKLVVVRRQ